MIIFDTETDSLDIFGKDIVLVCWSDGDQNVYSSTDVYALKTRLESDELKVGHNLKFEIHKLKNYGISLKPPYFDTMVAGWLLGQGKPNVGEDGVKYTYGLKDMAHHHLGVTEVVEFKNLAKQYGRKIDRKFIGALASEIPTDILRAYCEKDVKYTEGLYRLFAPRLIEAGLEKRWNKLEMPFIQVLVDMERSGICLDVKYLLTYRDKLCSQRDEVERKLNELVIL